MSTYEGGTEAPAPFFSNRLPPGVSRAGTRPEDQSLRTRAKMSTSNTAKLVTVSSEMSSRMLLM